MERKSIAQGRWPRIPSNAPAPGVVRGGTEAVEWPTIFLCGTIYVAWLFLTASYEAIPIWGMFVGGGLVTAWHASFQHEATHGHPTRNPMVNACLAGPSLLLWLPFALFRREHLRHHGNEALTDPIDDPESFYVLEKDWRVMNPVRRGLLLVNNTLAGRMLIGPALVIAAVAWRQAWLVGRGDRQAIKDWLLHLPGLALALGWLIFVVEMPIWSYALCFAYPGTAWLLLRSFIEHRPHGQQAKRTVIVEAGPGLSLLFLNNNLHALHHSRPDLPWYRLPATYRAQRARVLEENGGFLFAGYGDIARRFLLGVKDHPVHPTRDS
jgi:fatty acid desaturase